LLRVEDDTELLFDAEKDLYEKLGLPWIPPELREDRGEIQTAQEGTLPVLIKQEDIISELHSHSTWSDGRFSIKEMALGAIKRGYQILAITDHSQSLGIAGGLTADELKRQRDEIQKVQEELGDRIILLQGVEMEILADGALDFPDQVLAELDIVVASLHTSMRQSREKATARLLNAIHNPYVDIIGHPTNRLIGRRDPADLDIDAVLEAAETQGTALEINANPMRLDLSDIYVRRAIQLGIPISINTDAHGPDEFDYLLFGVATARRGWASADKVINTWPVETLIKWLGRNK
jgi:DNA polymerase (family 10)